MPFAEIAADEFFPAQPAEKGSTPAASASLPQEPVPESERKLSHSG